MKGGGKNPGLRVLSRPSGRSRKLSPHVRGTKQGGAGRLMEVSMPTAEQVQKMFAPLLPGLMGIEVEEATPEQVIATMLVRPDLCTVGNVLHGGAVMALADTVGAIGTVMNLAPRPRPTPLEPKPNCPRAATVNTRARAQSKPPRRGKPTQVWQTLIRSQPGKLCAVLTQTQMVLPA